LARSRRRSILLFYSGTEDNSGQQGTGFIVKSTLKKNVLGFEPLGPRMCKIRLKSRFRNISILSVYAPTEDEEDWTKTTFYDSLGKECNKIKFIKIRRNNYPRRSQCQNRKRRILEESSRKILLT